MFEHPQRALDGLSIPILFSQPFFTRIGHFCQATCDIYIIADVDAFTGDPYIDVSLLTEVCYKST